MRDTLKYKKSKGKSKVNAFLTHFLQQIQDAIKLPVKYVESTDPVDHPPILNFVSEHIQTWCKNADNWLKTLHYKFHIHGVPIQIHIYVPHNTQIKPDIEKMLHYIQMWFYMALFQTETHCKKEFRVFLYLTPFEKTLPDKGSIIDKENVNTGFTAPCQTNVPHEDIVIFRWQEWFKVLIHESFHLLGMDDALNKGWDTVLSRFIEQHVPNKGNKMEVEGIFEAYTETWAEIIHLLFRTHDESKHASLSYFRRILKEEQMFSAGQRKKIENVVKKGGLDYNKDLKLHSYYVLKQILIENMDDFIYFCIQVNGQATPLRKNRDAKQQNMTFWRKTLKKSTSNNIQHNTGQGTSMRMTYRDLRF